MHSTSVARNLKTGSVRPPRSAQLKAWAAEKLPLESKVVDRLLDLLSNSNEFRRLFKKDAYAALLQAGYRGPQLTRKQLVCMSANRIASKQEIAVSRQELRSHLTAAITYNDPHCFEADKVQSALRLR